MRLKVAARAQSPIREPIIVVGAARSGTRLLRNLIAAHPDVAAIPYDINFVWKYGNYQVSHDELTAEQLTPEIEDYIRNYFLTRQKRSGAPRLVEKTVSNGLRIEFVRKVFPDCRFIHLVRDGRDVAASARRMWQAPLDWHNALRKLRGFPLSGLPSYGRHYALSYLRRSLSKDRRLKTWGPRFRGIDEVVVNYPLLIACGIQWQRTLERTESGLSRLPGEAWHEVRYEALVQNTLEEAERILTFCGLRPTLETSRFITSQVRQSNLGKWRQEVSEQELVPLLDAIGSTLRRLGYLT